MFNSLDSLKPYAHWLLRIALASVFLYHGILKVIALGGFVEMSGLPMPVAALVAFAEVAGGAGIIVGAFTNDLITRLAALAIIPVMLGAIFMVHWGQWNFLVSESHPMGGIEFQTVVLLIALYFLIMGNAADSGGSSGSALG